MSYSYWRYNNTSRKQLDDFTTHIYDNLVIVSNAIFQELSIGYEEMVQLEEAKYYNSEKYKREKEKKQNQIRANSGKYEGFQEISEKLGFWVPADKSDGISHHITHSKPTHYDELSYEPIRLKDYVCDKAIILSSKYDSNSITTIVLEMLINEHSCYKIPKKLKDFCSCHYTNPNFSIIPYLCELEKLFPISVGRVLGQIGNIETERLIEEKLVVKENSQVTARIIQYQKITTFNIDTTKYPAQKIMLGKSIGEEFQFPNINLTYRIESISKKL